MQNYYYIRLNFILSIHKLSNFPNNKLRFNNQQNQSIETIYKTNLPLLSPQGDKLSKLVKFSNRISSNLKSSINLAPSSVSQIVKQQPTKWMQEAFVQMHTGGEPRARKTDPWDVTFHGDQELFIAVYTRARVCVCRPRSLRIPEFSVFEKSTETTVTALVIRDSQETRNTCSPLFPLSRGRVLASRGRFSCPGVSRCTAKINSPCASELHLFVFLGCYLNVRACVFE